MSARLVCGALLLAQVARAEAAEPRRPLSVVVLETGEGATAPALRLEAELQARGHTVRRLPCAPALSPDERCVPPDPRGDSQVIVVAEPPAPLTAWVRAGTRAAGPFHPRSDADAPAAFAAELVAWVESLAVRPEPPPVAAPIATLEAPVHGPARWHLGVGSLYLQSLTGLGARFGPELSVGVDRPTVQGRWGLRLSLWGSRWGPDPEERGVVVRRTPVAGTLVATAAAERGRWRLEGHLGAGAEYLRLRADDLVHGSDVPVDTGTRFGLIAQTGAALLRALGDPRDGFEAGLELRLVWSLPQQVVVIGDRRFGDSPLPSVGASLTLRWRPL